jgi:hypothetical protein
MRQIAGRNKNIRLILAGDGPLRKTIEEYIAEHNLDDAIHYVGKINFEKKPEFFSSLDALVLPAITLRNDKDGIPVVLMEAISYGLPIISTNISGIPEICINNFNGLLIPEKDVASLVDAIDTLYNDKLMHRQFARNSLRLFDSYNIESNSYHKLQKLNWIRKGEFVCLHALLVGICIKNKCLITLNHLIEQASHVQLHYNTEACSIISCRWRRSASSSQRPRSTIWPRSGSASLRTRLPSSPRTAGTCTGLRRSGSARSGSTARAAPRSACRERRSG